MAKVKSANTSTQPQKVAKIVDMYPDIFTFREKPVSEAVIERLMQEWIEWVKRPESLRIRQFWNEKGIPNKYMYSWMKKFPVVQMTHDYILDVLADKRDIGALLKNGELNGDQVRFSFWRYEQGEKEFIEWKAKLAKDEGQVTGNVKVVIEEFKKEQDEVQLLQGAAQQESLGVLRESDEE